MRWSSPIRSRSAVLAAGLCLLLAGCGERPRVEKLDMAKTYVATAEASAGAPFADAELEAARQGLAAAEAEYNKQGGFRLRHSPDEAHRLADRAIELANAASQHGLEVWRERSADARQVLAKAEIGVLSLETALSRMIRCHKESPITDARAHVSKVKELKAVYETASRHYDDGDPDQAIASSQRLPEELTRATRDIEHAIEGARCSKR